MAEDAAMALEPIVSRITTALPFEQVRKLLTAHCQEPFTMMVAPVEPGTDSKFLVINVLFASKADHERCRATFFGYQTRLRRLFLRVTRMLDRLI